MTGAMTSLITGSRAGLPADFRPQTASRRLAVRSADGTQLAVEVHGEPPGSGPQRPTVVLAHGWACSTSFWVRVINRLRTDLRVVVYDQRGHGRSQPVSAGGFTPAALADDLAAVVAATVPAGHPAVVAGHSMGAMSLVALAGRHPRVLRERVAGALLASTGVAELVGRVEVLPETVRRARRSAAFTTSSAAFTTSSEHSTSPRALNARKRLMRFGLADSRPLHALPRPLARALVADVAMSPSATRAEREYVADIVLACPPQTFTGFAEMLSELDLRPELAMLDVPALVLVGTRDRLTPPWHARRMVTELPRPLGIVELDGHGHMIPVSAPVTVSDAVRRLAQMAAPHGPDPTPTLAADPR